MLAIVEGEDDTGKPHYKVNEWFPNYGCSRYVLKNGDDVVWCYTCNLGYDVGGGYATGE